MSGVSFGLAEFHTGDRIVDLPVMEGASWASMLNRPDTLSCSLDLRDADVRALDVPSSTEPKKTVLFAETESGVILAWGVISDRDWHDDDRVLDIKAIGGWQYFNQRIIAPPAAATGAIIGGDGKVVTTYDTVLTDLTLGSIGIELVAQALSWPGAPVAFILPAPDIGEHERTYKLVDYKSVGSALTDLTKVENGPDFSFPARRDSTGLALEYRLRVGDPYLGVDVGSWPVGAPGSPITGLDVNDNGADLATHIWMQSGRTDSKVIVARAVNQDLIDSAGYPVLDFVDTSRTDITLQATLDAYAEQHRDYAASLTRKLSFNVKGDADLALGMYAPGDFAALDVAAGNFYLTEGSIPIRITGISGDETGIDVKIDCEVGELP